MIKKRLFRSLHFYALPVRYGILIFWGYAASSLWEIGHLDSYQSWGKLWAIWVPIMYALFSTSYVLMQGLYEHRCVLAPPPFSQRLSRFFRYDDHTYLALFLILGLELATPSLNNMYIWFSIVYLAILLIKTGLLVICLFHYLQNLTFQKQEPQHLPVHVKLLLVVIAFFLYSLVSVFHIQRTTTTGDEPHYLLITHSLWHDYDTNLYNNYNNHDYKAFYWENLEPAYGDQVSETEIYSYRHKGGFPLTLIPGYILGNGGRLGVTFQINLITAILMLQIFLLSYEIFHSLSASFVTWGCMAFTIPFIIYMGQIYPETLATLLAVWGVRQIRKLSLEKGWRNIQLWKNNGLIGITLLLLIFLKTRYLPLAGTIALFWMFRLLQERGRFIHKLRTLVVIGLASMLAGISAFWIDRVFFDSMFTDRITDTKYMAWFLEGYNPLTGLLGLLLDQEYGLFFYSPVYILALVGVGLLSRKELRETWPLLGIFTLNYLFISFWPLWHAAPTPPSRYILPVLPFLGIFFAKYWLQSGKFIRNVLFGVCGLWSFFMMWVVTLTPWWRYNWADGTNNFLEAQSWRLAINLPKLFPSFTRLSPVTPFLSLLILLSIAAMVYIGRFENRRAQSMFPQKAVSGFSGIVILTLFLILWIGILLAGKVLPTTLLEAEDALDMKANGGKRVPPSLDPWNNQDYLRKWKYFGWKLEPGESITTRLKLSHGGIVSKRRVSKTQGVQIYARALLDKDRPDDFPVMEVFVDEVKIQEIKVSSEDWKPYSVNIVGDETRPSLKIVHQSTQESQRNLILDKIRLR